MTFFNLTEAWRPGAIRYKIEESDTGRLVATKEEGRRRTDLIGTTRMRFAISSRALEALTDAGITGWSAREVDAPPGDEPMWLLVVEGRCGRIDLAKGEACDAGEKYPSFAGTRAVRGLTVDNETWDGSDIFLPQGQTWVLCTAKVRDAIVGAELTNVAIEPFEAIVVPRMSGE